MAHNYNISKESDLRRLERDLERSIKRQAKSAIEHDGVDVPCPQCGDMMRVASGKKKCPSCGCVTNFSFDWSGF